MACGRDAGPAILLDEGVSWALAEWRARTLSDIHYTYHLRVPRALEIPLEGTLVAQFQWLDAGANPIRKPFENLKAAGSLYGPLTEGAHRHAPAGEPGRGGPVS